MYTMHYVVLPQDDGKQIKRLIRGTMNVSYNQFSKLKAANGFMLDGVSVHANHLVHHGQTICLTLIEKDDSVAADDRPVDIVYEDDDLMVIDKCAPLACQSSPRQPSNTLENRLAHHFRDQSAYTFRPVNRLDKGTSGLMIAAKHAHAQKLLSAQLHSDSLVRKYFAIVLGCPLPAAGIIDQCIRKADGATIRREVHPDGKPARTHYETVFSQDGLSLLRLQLETGRTHQIRVHLSAMGCPVLGDFLYGREDDRLKGRFALHSTHLAFTHPQTGKYLTFDSPLPHDLAICINGELHDLIQNCKE